MNRVKIGTGQQLEDTTVLQGSTYHVPRSTKLMLGGLSVSKEFLTPQKNNLFKSNWLVNYQQKQYNHQEILLTLLQIQDYFEKNGIEFESINVKIDKKDNKCQFFKEKKVIYLNIGDIYAEIEEIGEKTKEIAKFKALKRPIKTISLLFPRLESDPRWRSIGMPAGQILLSSSLKARGFEPAPLQLAVSGKNGLSEALSADMAGMTLFEDLLPLLGPILADFRLSYRGILAAGGPFPTLAPLPAIFHLPQVNLFFRGEAELALPGILEALNEGDAEKFFSHEGVFWRHDGVIAMAGFDQAARPENLAAIPIDLGFMKPGDLDNGLEMNFSRGCRRGCVFCCRAQGRRFRKMPLKKAEELLVAYQNKIEALKSPRPLAGTFPLGKSQKGRIAEHCLGNEASPPAPPRCGMASPDASQNLGMALRTSPKGEGDLTKIDLSSKRRDLGMGPERMGPMLFHVNINDDDILQDPEYAGEIFNLIKAQGFRIFGVQTSMASLVRQTAGAGDPCRETLDLAADPGLYVGAKPLLWLGTDTFLSQRARRLGKKLPPPEKFRELLKEMERRGIRHYHYWISSDGDSNWMEFVEELGLIFSFFKDFPGFGLLAHAPFIVPYPSSALYSRLPEADPRLKIKLSLDAPDPRFGYKVAERLDTSWPQLNCLLHNDKAGGEKGFFDFLKEKDLMAAAQLAYHFFKQEIFQKQEIGKELEPAKRRLEISIEELMERNEEGSP